MGLVTATGISVAGWLMIGANVSLTLYSQHRMRELQKKAAKEARADADAAKGFQVTTRSNITDLPVVYGLAKVGGAVSDMYLRDSFTYIKPDLNPDGSTVTGVQEWNNGLGSVDIGKWNEDYTQKEIVWSTTSAIDTDPTDTWLSENINTTQTGDKNEYMVQAQAIAYNNLSSIKMVLVNDMLYDRRDFNSLTYSFNVDCQYLMDPDTSEYYQVCDIGTYRHHVGGGLVVHTIKDGNQTSGLYRLNNNITDPSRDISDESLFSKYAYAVGVFKLDRDEYQFNGAPTMQFIVKGAMVRAIRSTGFSGTYAYSSNVVAVLADYLVNTDVGRGLSVEDIDWESFYVAFLRLGRDAVAPDGNYFESYDTEQLYDKYTGSAISRSVMKVYEAHLALSTKNTVRENVNRILSTMHDAVLLWSGGKYKLSVFYPIVYSSNREYYIYDMVQFMEGTKRRIRVAKQTVPSGTLADNETYWEDGVDSRLYITDDDIIHEKELQISWPEAQNKYNYVEVAFLNAATGFKEDVVGWPAKGSALHQQYLSADGDQPLETSVFVDGIVNPFYAQARAEQLCRESRSAILYKFSLGIHKFFVEPGDLIVVDSRAWGVDEELLRVRSVEMEDDSTLSVEAAYFDAYTYAYNAEDTKDYPPMLNLESAIAAPLGLVYSGASDIKMSGGKLSWEASKDIRVVAYAVYMVRGVLADVHNGIEWIYVGTTKDSYLNLPVLEQDTYVFAIAGVTQSNKKTPEQYYAKVQAAITTANMETLGFVSLVMFKSSWDALTAPSGGSYDFSTSILTPATGWSASPTSPLDGDVYVTYAVVNSLSKTQNVVSDLSWTAPVIYTKADFLFEMTPQAIGIPANYLGTPDYTNAKGRYKVSLGGVEITNDPAFDLVFSVESSDGVTIEMSALERGSFSVTATTKQSASAIIKVVSPLFGTRTSSLTVVTLTPALLGDTVPPSTPGSPTGTSKVLGNDLYTFVEVKLSWLPSSDSDSGVSHYEVEYSIGAATESIEVISTSLLLDSTRPGDAISWRVRAFDLAGNASSWTTYQQLLVSGDATPPSPPSGVAVVGGLSKINLSWINPGERDYLKTRVYHGTDPLAINEIVYEGMGNALVFPVDDNEGVHYFQLSAMDVSLNESSKTVAKSASALKITKDNVGLFLDTVAITNAYIFNIDAAKITTGFLAAERIEASSITTDKLIVNKLRSTSAAIGELQVASIEGVSISAKLSAVDPDKSNVRMKPTGLFGYDSLGNQRFGFNVDGTFSMGNASNYISWNNSVMSIKGSIDVNSIADSVSQGTKINEG